MKKSTNLGETINGIAILMSLKTAGKIGVSSQVNEGGRTFVGTVIDALKSAFTNNISKDKK